MRIDPSFQYLGNTTSEGVGNAQGQQKVSSSETGAAPEAEWNANDGDTVQLSGTLAQVQQLKAQLAQTPDVRASRVTALQQLIAQGTYQPSNSQIADAMIAGQLGSSGQD